MHLDLNLLCQHAMKAAEAAASIISAGRQQTFAVERKTTGDSEASQVVTEIDRRAQRVIVETLAPTLRCHDLALLAEESVDDGERFVRTAFWCVDPMDGTLAFIRGESGFAVSIALVSREGVPLIGVVYDPITQHCYHAIKGGGAFRNDEPLVLEPTVPQLPLVLRTDISFERHPLLHETRAALQEVAARLNMEGAHIEFRIGAVMNAIHTLLHPNYVYFKFARADDGGGSVWDYAATACIYQELNAIACDGDGKPMDLNRAGSTFMNHRGIIYTASRSLADAIIDLMR